MHPSRPLLFLACLFLSLALSHGEPFQDSSEGESLNEASQRTDAQSIRTRLSYTAFKNQGRTRRVAENILFYWKSGTRFSENAVGQWMVANQGGIMVNGRPYDALPGSPLKVAMAADGNWIASSPEAFLLDGALFEDPATSARIHQDVMSFQTMHFGQAAPSRSPLRAGPNLAPRRLSPPTPSSLPLVQPAPYQPQRNLDITVDTEAPLVTRLLITRNPDNPQLRRAGFPPRVFVGATPVEFEILMTERMGTAPTIEVVQADGTRTPAALSQDRNPVFVYRWFPFLDPAANGPATVEVTGGADEAGNPVQPAEGSSTFTQALIVDTLPPEMRRMDLSQPGAFRLQPREGEVLAKHEFPRSIVAFIQDYDQPVDPDGAGPTSTQNASGVDFRRIGDGSGAVSLKLLDPNGREIRGTLAARVTALELFLPDIYDPANQIFPDDDQDGVADPIEGTYRVQIDMVDEVGNSSTLTLPFGADTTPIRRQALEVSVRPIFATPPTPNPLPESGEVWIRRLEAVEVRSQDPDFSFTRSLVKVLSLAAGRHTVPVELVGNFTRGSDLLRFDIARDQDGDGQDDFENPAPGEFLPPGVPDPRLGKNDGLYRIVVEAFDQAGNPATITRDISIDTTPPEVGSAFPTENTTQFAPLRMVDVQLSDPQARSGSKGSGVGLRTSQISLRFLGNQTTPAQEIRGLPFLHQANPDDPTRPDFNPDDKYSRLLLELVDELGQVTKLPDDGSFDGIFQLDVVVRDVAGNEAMGTTTFLYQSFPPEVPTTDPLGPPDVGLPPLPTPLQIALVRP
jgi:hypothetical protein